MPDKFSQPLQPASPLNLIFDVRVVNLQLLDIVDQQEQGYALLGEMVWEGNNSHELREDHPSFQYKKNIPNMSLFDMPNGPIVVFSLSQIVIPKITYIPFKHCCYDDSGKCTLLVASHKLSSNMNEYISPLSLLLSYHLSSKLWRFCLLIF